MYLTVAFFLFFHPIYTFYILALLLFYSHLEGTHCFFGTIPVLHFIAIISF